MLESRSFDVCRNTTAPMIVMLGYSEINIEVLDVGIETAESNDCKEMLRDNRDTNRVLTTM